MLSATPQIPRTLTWKKTLILTIAVGRLVDNLFAKRERPDRVAFYFGWLFFEQI